MTFSRSVNNTTLSHSSPFTPCIVDILILGSENRLFLVLVDSDDFNNSWKLKRNLDLLKPVITSYLDNFQNKKLDDLKINFQYGGKAQTFNSLADVIFVIK